ncbi:MAG: hypothetical protein KIT44_01885 [Opitutaceae bacterium]|nr:hypothetical protein [Opitutaceae bacterium]
MNTATKPQSTISIVRDAQHTGTLSNSKYDFIVDQVAAGLINDPSFIECLAEKMITQEFIEKIAAAVSVSGSDPFDSIYISDLKPDALSAKIIADIDNVSGITDVSDIITFDDDLD